jgi:hypothetical protein
MGDRSPLDAAGAEDRQRAPRRCGPSVLPASSVVMSHHLYHRGHRDHRDKNRAHLRALVKKESRLPRRTRRSTKRWEPTFAVRVRCTVNLHNCRPRQVLRIPKAQNARRFRMARGGSLPCSGTASRAVPRRLIRPRGLIRTWGSSGAQSTCLTVGPGRFGELRRRKTHADFGWREAAPSHVAARLPVPFPDA